MELMNFIINSIFRNPPVLLGLIAALGLALQKKPFGTIVKGALMTVSYTHLDVYKRQAEGAAA